MSGHSKWAKIKHSKGVKDVKKGALFTKLAKNISLAAKEAGGDADTNFSLRLAIDKAKDANMPSSNIDKAIKKGTGEGEKMDIVRASYEAFGLGGVSIIIDCQTDNTNRSVAELRKIVESAGGKFASINSVSWKFMEKGLIAILLKKIKKSEQFGKEDTLVEIDGETAELELLEVEGVDDIKETSNIIADQEIKALEIFTEKVDFARVLVAIQKLEYKIVSAELIKMAKEDVSITEEFRLRNDKLVEALEEHDDVDAVWMDY
ncbi:MAG: YebC/PmpR family DNA-binding transcriptional regulator [bacterium]